MSRSRYSLVVSIAALTAVAPVLSAAQSVSSVKQVQAAPAAALVNDPRLDRKVTLDTAGCTLAEALKRVGGKGLTLLTGRSYENQCVQIRV